MKEHLRQYKGKSVLITGGLGFIGSNLALKLFEVPDINISIIDSLSSEQGGNLFNIKELNNKVILSIDDIGNEKIIGDLVKNKDYIFNLAGNVSHIDSMEFPIKDLNQNVTSHVALLEACRKYNPNVKIVYTSTRQIYGRPEYLPLDELHPINPVDVNGINKLACENYHLLYNKKYGIRCACLRLTNTFGPRQLIKHNRQGVIGWFIRQALIGGEIELYEGGDQIRDFTFVDDVVSAILLAGISSKTDGQIFNLGGKESISLKAIAEQLITVTNKGFISNKSFPLELKRIDIGSTTVSYRKFAGVTDWYPKVSLSEGLKKTLDFFNKNLVHYLDADENTV